MQPRQQPLSKSGPRGPRSVAPLLALLLLLALQGTGAAPAGPRESEKPENYTLPPWLSHLKVPGEILLPGGIAIPGGILRQAALVAVHFLNFREGSPSALQVLSTMYRAGVRETPRKEYNVEAVFTTEHYKPEEGKEKPLGQCAAHVVFRKGKPRPTVNINCEGLPEKNQRLQEDYLLYKQLKQLHAPLDVVSIPDSHGYIDPSLRPLWDLAALGSSYVMWDKATNVLQYSLVQLIGVKEWKTDGKIDFDYTVLLHEFPTQEIIPCRIHLVWYPGKQLKVKYHCQGQQTPDQGQETPDQGQETPDQGQETPDQGQQTSDQGQETPDQGQQTLDQGQLTPDQGQQTPDQGQLTPDQGQLTPEQIQQILDQALDEIIKIEEGSAMVLTELSNF